MTDFHPILFPVEDLIHLLFQTDGLQCIFKWIFLQAGKARRVVLVPKSVLPLVFLQAVYNIGTPV